MHMKAFRYLIIPVSFISVLTSNVYANSISYSLQSGIYSFFRMVYYIIMFALILLPLIMLLNF